MTENDSLRSYQWQAPDMREEGARAEQAAEAADVSTIRVGFVGLGGMGLTNLKGAMAQPGIIVAALCDVDETHLALPGEKNDALREHCADVPRFSDFRELMRSDDVDAVVISTPDHWHALQAIDAMQCGKDAYVEKPLTLTVVEGRALCRVAEETGRICQTGTQQRSSGEFRFACELVRNGRIGDVQRVHVTIPANNRKAPESAEPMPVPDSLDYDMWLGPAPLRDYHDQQCHYNFRFISDYSGGQMTNWGAHVLDIVQWALGMDHSGPVYVEGHGTYPESGAFDTAREVDLTWRYADGVELRCTTGRPRTIFHGTRGSITVGRGLLESEPASIVETPLVDSDERLYRSDDHLGNFFDCVRSRKQPICPPEVGHRSATVCHIGNIAMRLGRPLRWDPGHERFVDDGEANELLSRPMRDPWSLPQAAL